MTEFEKWWKKNYGHRIGNNTSHLGYPEAAKAWQAVLEWVLKQETWIGVDEGGEYGIPTYTIEEELENLTQSNNQGNKNET